MDLAIPGKTKGRMQILREIVGPSKWFVEGDEVKARDRLNSKPFALV